MSKQYDNTNRGVLFKNDKKSTDKHPDYTGKIDVNGAEFKVAAWIKESPKGKFMSLSISTPKDKPAESKQSSPDFADSEIPF
jgi:uncharacterized protein (DUF736 family)